MSGRPLEVEGTLVHQSSREGDAAVVWQRADGSGVAERLTRPGEGQMHFADGMSPDGRHLLVQAGEALHVLSLEAFDRLFPAYRHFTDTKKLDLFLWPLR